MILQDLYNRSADETAGTDMTISGVDGSRGLQFKTWFNTGPYQGNYDIKKIQLDRRDVERVRDFLTRHLEETK